MNRIILKILILLGFVLVLLNGNSLSAQSSNPFQLFSPQDSIFLDSSIEIIEILDTLSVDSSVISQIEPITSITPEVPIAEIAPEKQISQNPFELVSRVINQEVIQEIPISEQSESISNIVIDTSSENEIINDSLSSNNTVATLEDPLLELESDPNSLPLKGKNLIVFLITLFCGLILSVAINSNRNILRKIWKSLRNLSYMKLLQKEERNGLSGGFIILYIIYVLNAAIFVRFLCLYYKIPFLNANLFGILFVLTLFILLRHLSLVLISYLRKRLPDAINYSFIITTINLILGLVLIPINLLIAFGPDFIANKTIVFGLVIIALSYLLRWFRGLLNSLRIIIGDSFHFLLYLCTCEIVPVMIIIGYVRSLIN